MRTTCIKCGGGDDFRGGFCWDCAHNGERKAANSTVIQHLGRMLGNLSRGRFWQAKFDARWAFERLTATGDYRHGGYFEKQVHFRTSRTPGDQP